MLSIITKTIIEYVDVELDSLTRGTNPVTDLQLNSYDLMCIIGQIESELGVRVNERDLRGLATLGDLDDYLRSRL